MDIKTRPDRLAKPTYSLSPSQFQFPLFIPPPHRSSVVTSCAIASARWGFARGFTPWHPSSFRHLRTRAWFCDYGGGGWGGGLEHVVGRQNRCEQKTLNCGISCPAAALRFLSGRSFIHGEVGSLQRERARAKIRHTILTEECNSLIIM